MAAPIIKLKRSAVAGKRPTLANLPLGEIALNTYDGKLFVRQDTSGVGIATTVRTVNPWSENFVSGGEHSIYYDGGKVGIGTDNPTNADFHVEGRNFAFGGPGDNESGAGNVYIGNFDDPLSDSYERNVRIGSKSEIQIELYTALNATEYSDTILFSSTSGIGLQYSANNGSSTRSGVYPFYYSVGNAITDDYIYFQAGSKYLWFDGDTGRLGINRSSGSGWSDTLDVNGSAKVNGDLTVTGLSTFTGNVSFASSALFGDNDKILLGDDNDLEIYHGSGSWIRSVNAASNLFVTSALGLQLRVNSSEVAFNAVANGAAELFYNNVEKLETTASGINVTGHTETDTLNVSGLSTFVGDANFDSATLYVDSTNNRVGLGLTNPSVPLHMFGSYPTLKIQNSATAQYASASIDLQGPAGDERYTKILHGNSNTGGTETYFQIEQYDSAGSYVKQIAHYNYENDYWNFLPAGTERLRVNTSGINVTGHTETDTLNVSGISTFGGKVNADAGLEVSGDTLIANNNINTNAVRRKGHTNTRLEFPADNEISLQNSSGSILRVKDDRVGINSTTPTASLDVNGTVNVSGVSTFNDSVDIEGVNSVLDVKEGKIYTTEVQGNNRELYIRGGGSQSTRPTIHLPNGTNPLSILGNSSNTQGIVIDSRSTGVVDIKHNSSTKLQTTGAGVTVFGTTQTQQLNVSGLSTFASALDINDDVHVSGVVTATEFHGDGSNLTGITADAAVGVQTSGGYVGSGVTAFSFEGNAVGNVTVPSSGISTININATTALSRTVTNVTPTQDQTDFTVSYQVGFIDVYLNGVLLSGSDFTATNGTSVSISTSLSTTDNVDFIAYEGVSAGVVDGVNRWTSVGSSIYNNNSGNVGIGTEKPNSKLQVFGGIVAGDATSGTSSSGFSIFRPYDSTPRTFAIVEDDTKLRIGGGAWDSINFRTAPSNDVRVAITSTGNVGLGGTEEPTQILQIAGNGGTRTIQYGDNSVGYFISNTNVNRTSADQVIHSHQYRWDDTKVAQIRASTGNHLGDKDAGYLTFWTSVAGGGGVRERLRINDNGRVGIGEESPDELLEVAGNIKLGASSGTAEFYTDLPELRIGVDKNNNNSDSDITFYTNNSEKVRINNDGDVGIGSAAPGSRLHVFSGNPEVILVERSSNANAAIQYTNTEGSMYAGLTSNAESWAIDDDNNLGAGPMFCVLRSNGNVGINSSIPGEALDVNGNVKAVDFNSTSDIKLKDKVRKISKPLSKLDKIRGVSFEWKETKQKSMGVVAQEVEKVIPDLVRGDETKTVNYNGLIGLLIECVKEQQIRIDQLEQKLGQL